MKLSKFSKLTLLGLLFSFMGGSVHAVTQSYSFSYQGKHHSLSLDLPDAIVKHYGEKKHYWPRSPQDYAKQSREDAGYEYLQKLASQIKKKATAAGYSGYGLVGYTASLVQNLTYIAERQEYVRYPIETLKDKGGDCEDSSILLASLLDKMGKDAVLIYLPGHMVVAVKCADCTGATLTHKGSKYQMIETTAPIALGVMDKRFANAKATVVELTDGGPDGGGMYAVTVPKDEGGGNGQPSYIDMSNFRKFNFDNLPGFTTVTPRPKRKPDESDGSNYFDNFPGFANLPDHIKNHPAFQSMPDFSNFDFGDLPGFADRDDREVFKYRRSFDDREDREDGRYDNAFNRPAFDRESIYQRHKAFRERHEEFRKRHRMEMPDLPSQDWADNRYAEGENQMDENGGQWTEETTTYTTPEGAMVTRTVRTYRSSSQR